MPAGSRVAVVGAGNADDLPLGALARRASGVDLVDLDAAAARRGRRRLATARRRVRVLEEDVTLGAADAVVARARTHTRTPTPAPAAVLPSCVPVGEAPYDVVVADAVLTQLLFPALLDAGLPGAAIDAVLLRDGPALTDAVVARLLASVGTDGTLVVVHDALGWWDGHPQPFALGDVLAAAADAPAPALALVRRGAAPYGCDPHRALRRADAEVLQTAFWRWPFAPGVDYLVCGLVARPRRSSG